jgi:hypothetical protein
MREQRRLLVDDGDAALPRRKRTEVLGNASLDREGPGIGLHGPCENFDEGGLAGAVLTDDRVDFAWLQVERDVPQRLDTGV